MNRRVLVACLSGLLFFLSAVVVTEVAADWNPPANADVCWGNTDATLRLRFINVGGGYYQIAGKLTGSGEGTKAAFGSAVRASKVYYISATLTGSTSSQTWMETARIVLNRSNLSLTVETMGVSHDKTDPDPENAQAWYDAAFTLPHITCP